MCRRQGGAERTGGSGELVARSGSKVRGAGVAAMAACTGADFQSESVTAAIVCCLARHWKSESPDVSESPATWPALAPDIAAR